METLAEEMASRPLSRVIAETFMFSIINFTAIVGNVSVLIAIGRNANLRTIPNISVAALAVSDLLIAFLCMPFSVATLGRGEWSFGAKFCHFHGFEVFTFCMVSVLNMGLISISHYFRVVRPHQFRVIFTRRRTVAFITAIWLLVLTGSSAPHFFKPSVFQFHPGKVMCLYNFKSNTGYSLFIDIIYVSVPLGVITVCYAKIFRHVSRTNKIFSQQNDMERLRANITEAKVTKTLVAVVVVFCTCWGPIFVVDIIDMAHQASTPLTREVYFTYAILAYLSSTLNPFIYGVTNKTFRREYYSIARRLFCFKAESVTAINGGT